MTCQSSLVAILLAVGFIPVAAQRPARPHWVVSWSASQSSAGDRPAFGTKDNVPTFANLTLREIVHTTLDGDSVRIHLSNEYGDQPLVIGQATIAVRADSVGIQAGSARALTFGGRSTVTIGAGASVVSDPVAYAMPALADVAVSLYLPDSTRTATRHLLGLQTNYVSGAGNFSDSASFEVTQHVGSWIFLAGLDVTNSAASGTIVTLGNSITDGYHSSPDSNRRWPDVLARRLHTTDGAPVLGIANAGISGNRVLNPGAGPSALARFDRDVLAQAGVRYLIVLEGINDIGWANASKNHADSVSANDVIFGLRQIVERAHDRGIVVYGATLTPFAAPTPNDYYSAASEAKRQAVNAWIRTSGVFDGVIDFDAATRDPSQPTRFLPAYDGDHLHPNDAGYAAMANAIDLNLFRAIRSHR